MKISVKWLKDKRACTEAIDKFREQNETDGIKIVDDLIENKRFGWANWLVVRLLNSKNQKVQYAIFAAEQVIETYEKKYPNDNRPRKAIDAAKRYLKTQTKKNKTAAYAAAHAAYTAHAAYAAYTGYAASSSPVYAAYAAYTADAADAAEAATDAADAAANAAYAAADAADAAADAAAKVKMYIKIINYGKALIK